MWPTSPFGPHAAGAAAVAPNSQPVIISVSLRGGADGLSLVPAPGDPSYFSARGVFAPDGELINAGGIFALHPNFASLKPAWDAKEFAVVHAVHTDDDTQSHFSAIDLVDRGNEFTGLGGWLGGSAVANGLDEPMNQVSIGTGVQPVMRSTSGGVVLTSVDELQSAISTFANERSPLAAMYAAAPGNLGQPTSAMFAAADATLDIDTSSAGIYPSNNFEGPALREAALLIKADIGVANIAINSGTIENGGRWDTHSNQKGTLPGMIGSLSDGLAAFREDLGEHWDRVIVVVQSEFGRSVNIATMSSGGMVGPGTDHGFAGAMLLLGGQLREAGGGKVHGEWPGLGSNELHKGRYLAKATDMRTVLTEVLTKHMRYQNLDQVFPTFDHAGNPELGLLADIADGDVDGNGVLDDADVKGMLDANVGKPAAGHNDRAGDINNDGRTDLLDALIAAQLAQ